MSEPSISQQERHYFAISEMEKELNKYYNGFNRHLPRPEEYEGEKAKLVVQTREKLYAINLSGTKGISDMLIMRYPETFTETEVAELDDLLQNIDFKVKEILAGKRDNEIEEKKRGLSEAGEPDKPQLPPELLNFKVAEKKRREWYLVRGTREGYEGAKRKVFKGHEKHVRQIIKKHCDIGGLRAGLTKDEMLHVGLNAVEQAAKDFDPNKSNDFLAHYYDRVRSQIGDFMNSNLQEPKPNSDHPKFRSFGAACYRLNRKLGREPNVDNLAKEFRGSKKEEMQEYMEIFQGYSIDADITTKEDIVRWIKQLEMQGLIGLLRNALSKQEAKEIEEAIKRQEPGEEFNEDDINEDVLFKLRRYFAFREFSIRLDN